MVRNRRIWNWVRVLHATGKHRKDTWEPIAIRHSGSLVMERVNRDEQGMRKCRMTDFTPITLRQHQIEHLIAQPPICSGSGSHGMLFRARFVGSDFFSARVYGFQGALINARWLIHEVLIGKKRQTFSSDSAWRNSLILILYRASGLCMIILPFIRFQQWKSLFLFSILILQCSQCAKYLHILAPATTGKRRPTSI